MKRLLIAGVLVAAGLGMFPVQASASTLAQCLAQQHVCVSGSARSIVSASQENQLERQIGTDGIYVVVAPSGSAGYNSAMRQVINDLNGHAQFTVGFLDSRLRHFGAYSQGAAGHDAAAIATQVVRQHQADGNIDAALTQFVREVRQQASSAPGSTPAGSTASGPSHLLRNVLIVAGVIILLGLLGAFFIIRPIRRRGSRNSGRPRRPPRMT